MSASTYRTLARRWELALTALRAMLAFPPVPEDLDDEAYDAAWRERYEAALAAARTVELAGMADVLGLAVAAAEVTAPGMTGAPTCRSKGGACSPSISPSRYFLQVIAPG